MAVHRHRFNLVEYGPPTDLSGAIHVATGKTKDEAKRLVFQAGERIARSLRFNQSPITLTDIGVRAVKVAGMLRLGPSLELEIAPKFLGTGIEHRSWREDFFFLATLSKHGQLLAAERLGASGGAPPDLTTLIARAMTAMYWDNHRRPLRTYNWQRQSEFALDGEVDPLSIAMPDAEGFEQRELRLTQANSHNGRIAAAVSTLIPQVSDPRSVAGLRRISARLGNQRAPTYADLKKIVPTRSRRWQPLLDLSGDVLRRMGLGYDQGAAHAPGFVVSTWQVWEDLLSVAARVAFGAGRVRAQHGVTLGSRNRVGSPEQTALKVHPDLAVEIAGNKPFLIDAKYKGKADQENLGANEADVYEALAFAQATGNQRVFLAYPKAAVESLTNLGSTKVLEVITVNNVKIVAVRCEVRGISRRGGLRTFSKQFGSDLLSTLHQVDNPP